MLEFKKFEIIKLILKEKNKIVYLPSFIMKKNNCCIFKSKNEICKLIKELENEGYIEDNMVTENCKNIIKDLRVQNAVILAAGESDISAKSIYSMPKGLYIKNGETLIERQIRQLIEVGITDISVVIGYKQEQYFYLQNKWNVNLIVNPEFHKNNICSIYVAKNKFSNTYILNCDNYYEENPFSLYEFNSFHATVLKKMCSNKLVINKNQSGRILDVYTTENEGECLFGFAYVNSIFCKRFFKFLDTEITNFRIQNLFWQEYVYKHIDDLSIYARTYKNKCILEFNSIEEIQNVDCLFFDNVAEKINNKIVEVFKCQKQDIKNIKIVKKGLTNILFTFDIKNETYIFRYPGEKSSFYVSRKNECKAEEIAFLQGVDPTYIYCDLQGIKISKFLKNIKNISKLYYKDMKLMKKISKTIRKFHDGSNKQNDLDEYEFDALKNTEKFFIEASKMKGDLLHIFKDEWELMRTLKKYLDKQNIKKVMCHNDLNKDNVLITNTDTVIIDYEFAGVNYPGVDFGWLFVGYDIDTEIDKIKTIICSYLGYEASDIEIVNFIAGATFHNFYFLGWALYKESINETSRDWMLMFYNSTKKFAMYCIEKYNEICK